MIPENHVKHLWDCALSLNGEAHSKKLIKSYLLNVCRQVAGTRGSIPLERFAESQMCRQCSMHWHENDLRIKLKPQTINIKTNKTMRLIAKLKAQENGNEVERLPKKQKKRAKWLLKRAESKLEIKCQFCYNKTLLALNKPVKAKSEKISITNDIVVTEAQAAANKKKKKKSKNLNAGLKIPKKSNESDGKKISLSKVKTVEETITKELKTTDKSQPIGQKSKKQQKKSQSVQSKTQKQNSLLQLAALLKSQGSSKTSGSSNANNRLESLLK